MTLLKMCFNAKLSCYATDINIWDAHWKHGAVSLYLGSNKSDEQGHHCVGATAEQGHCLCSSASGISS